MHSSSLHRRKQRHLVAGLGEDDADEGVSFFEGDADDGTQKEHRQRERGEVQGNNTGLSNITVNKADWLRDGKVRILLQYGTERLPSLPNVPTVVELAKAEQLGVTVLDEDGFEALLTQT